MINVYRDPFEMFTAMTLRRIEGNTMKFFLGVYQCDNECWDLGFEERHLGKEKNSELSKEVN